MALGCSIRGLVIEALERDVRGWKRRVMGKCGMEGSIRGERLSLFMCALYDFGSTWHCMVRDIIKDICRRDGISRYRLAKVMGVTDVSVTNWYTGRRTPNKGTKTLLKLLQRYGTSLLLSGELSQPVDSQQNDRLKIT